MLRDDKRKPAQHYRFQTRSIIDSYLPLLHYRRFYSTLSDSLINRLRGKDERDVIFAALELVRYGERAVPKLIVGLGDADINVRRRVIWVLWQIGDERAVTALMAALRYDSDAKVRRYSAWTLGLIGGEDAVKALIDGFDDDDERVRWDVAVALGKIGPAALEQLQAALQYGAPRVRAGAANAMGWINSSASLGALLAALRDPAPEVRVRAAFAICWIGNTRAIQALIVALRDEHPLVRQQAAVGLGWLRNPRAISPLVRLMDDPDPICANTAAEALAQIGGDRALTPLIFAARFGNPRVSSAALTTLMRLGIDPRRGSMPRIPTLPERRPLWYSQSRNPIPLRCNIVLSRR